MLTARAMAGNIYVSFLQAVSLLQVTFCVVRNAIGPTHLYTLFTLNGCIKVLE